jgi:diacylglycerol kinase (ATP)
MRNIIYIINPVSGTRNKKDLHSFIETRTAAMKFPYRIFPSVASGDYSFLHPLIKDEGVTDIVIAGGDGTVSQVIGSLLAFDVNFAIIPCGSGNGLAFAAGIPKNPEAALNVLINGSPHLTDGFYLNEQFACTLSGLGFDAKVAHGFAQQPKRGLMTYVKQVVRNFLSARTYRFEIKVGNLEFKTDAYFISIANSNQYGNNFTIAPKASLTDGLLDIVIVTKQHKLSLLLETLKQVRGKNKLQPEAVIDHNKAVIYFQTEKLEIENKSEAPLHIDGDPADTPERIKVRVRKKCFRLLQPS